MSDVRLTNANGSTLPIGTPVYASAAGSINNAKADAAATALCIGLVAEPAGILTTAKGLVRNGGMIRATTGQWDTITGQSGGLTFGATYYLSSATAGKLVVSLPGTFPVCVGVAMSATEMAIGIGAVLTNPGAAINVKTYGAVGDGATDDRAAITAAVAAAYVLGVDVYFPAGTYKVTRTPGAFHSLILQSLDGLTIRGDKGRTWIKHPADAASGTTLCEMLRISDCKNITIKDIGFDGNWGNAVTYVGSASDQVSLAAIPSNTLTVESTTGFPSSGSFTVVTSGAAVVLTYSGKTSTTFTGVSAGSGILRAGDSILYVDKAQKTTTISSGSNGATLPQSTINVASTTGFPSSAVSGLVRIVTTGGVVNNIAYTGKTGTTFTGCTGGTGTMTTGDDVQYVDGAINQAGAAMQVDPKNYCVFVYGSDGTNRTPNENITLEGCRFHDTYGDFVWIGAWSKNVKLIDCVGDISARNGVTLSSYAEGVHMTRCKFTNVFTSAVDSEPVDAGVSNVTIDDCDLGLWANPYHDTGGNIALSIQGGVVGRPAEWNYARGWRVLNSRVDGSTYISDARDVHVTGCRLLCDFAGTSMAPVNLSMSCDDVYIERNYVYSRLTPSTQYNYGAISVSAYITTSNTAAQPGNVYVRGNTVHGRNATDGIYADTTGGYSGASGTASGITAASAPSTHGTVTDAAAAWTTNIYGGHQIMMGGALANIVSNTATVLTIAPIYEQFAANFPGFGTSWADARGNPVPAPTAGAYVIQPIGGTVLIEGNIIDCVNNDGAGAGGYGVRVTTQGTGGTWATGMNDMRVRVEHNDIRGATGHGVHTYIYGTPGIKYLSIADNHIWDDQPVPTCTHAVYFTNNAGVFDVDAQISKLILRNNHGEGVRVKVGGLVSGSWYEEIGDATRRVGFGTPEAVYAEPIGSTYRRKDGAAGTTFYVKEDGGSPVNDSAGAGSTNVAVSTDQTRSLTTVTTTVDNCLIICAVTAEPGSGASAWDQPTNSGLASFTEILEANSVGDIWAAAGVKVAAGSTGAGTVRQHAASNEYGPANITYAIAPQIPSVAPTWVANGTQASATTGTISPVWPTHQEDDYAILFVETLDGDAATLSVANEFVALPNSPQVGSYSAVGSRITAFGCRAYKSSMAAPTVTHSGAHILGVIVLIRGASNSSAIGWAGK